MFQTHELGYTNFLTLFVSTPTEPANELEALLGFPPSGDPTPLVWKIQNKRHVSDKFKSFSEEKQRKLILSFCTVYHELRHVRQLADNSLLPYVLLERLKCYAAARIVIREAKKNGAKGIKLPLLGYVKQLQDYEKTNHHETSLVEIKHHLELLKVICGYDVKQISYLQTNLDAINRRFGWSKHYISRSHKDIEATTSPFHLHLTHLLEGQARCADMAAAASLVHVGDIPKDIVYGIVNELWETQGYREAHDFLRRYVNPATLDRVSIFEVLLFIALNPAIPSFNVPEDTEICWQHIQPVWRYAQCVAHGCKPMDGRLTRPILRVR